MNLPNNSNMTFGAGSSLFGQTATPQQSTGSIFGNTSFGTPTPFAANTSLTAFGQQQTVAGTTVRFVPLAGSDTVPKSQTNPGGPTQITTRHQNISAMKEYETKSVDELRLEDYAAGRKGPIAGSTTTPFGGLQPSIGLSTPQSGSFNFGQPAASTSATGSIGFNTPGTSNLFGVGTSNPLQNQQATQSPFNMNNSFTQNTSATANKGFSMFSSTQPTTGPFGTTTLNDPTKTGGLFSTPTTQGSSLFGNTSTASTGFLGQSNAIKPFGASTSLFGQTNNNTSTTNSLFGATNTATTGFLGQSNTIKPFESGSSLFGQTAGNTAATPFGANTSTAGQTGFGFGTSTSATQPTTSLFNTTSLSTDANKNTGFQIGQTPSGSFNFGQPAAGTSATGTLGFNTSGTTNLFGVGTSNSLQNQQATQSPFNINNSFTQNTSTNANKGFSMFGNTQTAAGPFGATTLNDPTKTGGLFSTPTTQSSSLFGNTNTASTGFLGQSNAIKPFGTSTSLFGQTNNTTTTTTNSLFGNTNTATTGFLGQSNTIKPFESGSSLFSQAPTNATTAPFGTNTGVSGQTGFGFGTSTNTTQPTTSLFNATSLTTDANKNTGFQIGQTQSPFKALEGSDLLLNRLKTLPYGTTSLALSDTSNSSVGLGALKFTTDPKTSSHYKMNAKTNVTLDKSVSSDKTRANSVLFDGMDDTNNEDLRCAIDVFVPKKNIKKLVLKSSSSNYISDGDANRNENSPPLERTMNINQTCHNDQAGERFVHTNRSNRFTTQNVSRSMNESSISSTQSHSNEPFSFNNSMNSSAGVPQSELAAQQSQMKCGVISTRRDYRLKPSLEQIERKYNSENGTCILDSLLIERPNYGSILFEQKFDVKGLNIDEIAHIRRKEVVVYPDDEKKPPVGQGLNRPATVTLDQVWPVDKSTNEIIKDVDRLIKMKYPERIEAVTIEKGARFLEYRPETGSWVFSVKHFSKYALTEDDEATDKILNISSQQPEFKTPQRDVPERNIRLASEWLLVPDQLNLHMPEKPEFSFMRSALFEEDIEIGVGNESKRSLTVHGTKRIALQNSSPGLNSSLMEKPIISGASVPKQRKIRDMKLKPDLFVAQNKLIRDISSVCVSGAHKIKFFNGSRRFCTIVGGTVSVFDLELINAKDNTLTEEVGRKFETFLIDHSLFKNDFNAPNLITTDSQVSNASSHDLLQALHGDTDAESPYCEQNIRLEKIINWLASVNRELPIPTNLYHRILYHMSCDRYDLATSEALKHDHPHLALLAASLNLNKDVLRKQLDMWYQHGADQFIDEELLRLYALLSGDVEWKTSDKKTINCRKGMTWTQQLCIFALHSITSTAAPKEYGLKLLPLYVQTLDTDTNDVDYHILARHNPAVILSASRSLLEEWFLLESLKSFNMVNFINSENCDSTDIIHCTVASQLGPIDLRWACFVALHIVNSEIRSHVLLKCLEQNVHQLKEERRDLTTVMTVEDWLTRKLKISPQFISRAKAVLK